jgi:ribonuclease HI
MYKYFFNLHLFDGEGGSAAAGADGGTGETGQLATVGANGQTAPAEGTDFEKFISEHKDESDKWFSQRFQETFNKRYAPIKKELNATRNVMEMLAVKYGIEDVKDIGAITKALEDDDLLYAERAEANGRTIEDQRNWDKLERENRLFRQQREESQRQQQIQQQMDEWDRQSQNLKQMFPSFNLDQELRNPDFENALRSGLSMERAFYAAHGEEIFSGAMESTAQAVRQATVNDMAARRSRPKENALGANASASVSKDVHKLTKAERAELARQSMYQSVHL